MTVRPLADALAFRFGEVPDVPPALDHVALAGTLAARASCRRFAERPVEPALVRTLAALALAAPTKSDLQQADVVLVTDPALLAALAATVDDQPWVAQAPALAVLCGNARRQRQLHAWRGHAFVNDHLDAFFNATVDGAIVLATFVLVAEASGLGCCCISGLRSKPEAVSELLGLPDLVIPIAGLALGYPAHDPKPSPRLPLAVTVHENGWSENGVEAHVRAYDARRQALRPYARQRDEDRFGRVDDYGWSEDKARQYATPQRADFGAFVRRKGFDLG